MARERRRVLERCNLSLQMQYQRLLQMLLVLGVGGTLLVGFQVSVIAYPSQVSISSAGDFCPCPFLEHRLAGCLGSAGCCCLGRGGRRCSGSRGSGWKELGLGQGSCTWRVTGRLTQG